jgi:DNA topoisomerase-1
LSLPREVGRHPEDGEPIRAGIGRFGPYVQHGKTYANLESADDVFNIGLNRAVTLIAEKVARGPRSRRFGADPGRPLGEHPTKGGPIAAKNGRYGPYVSHAGVNATLPRDKTPETITLDEAVALLDARAERGATTPNARRRKSARAAPGTARPSTRPAPKAPTNAPKKSAAAAGKKSARRRTQAAE